MFESYITRYLYYINTDLMGNNNLYSYKWIYSSGRYETE